MALELIDLNGTAQVRLKEAVAMTNAQISIAKQICEKYFDPSDPVTMAAVIQALATNYNATVISRTSK